MTQKQLLGRIRRAHGRWLERAVRNAYQEGFEAGLARAHGTGRRGRTIRGDATVAGLVRLMERHFGLERYGFEVKDFEPSVMDRLAVPPSTDLRALAHAAGMPSDALRTLNPVLVRGVTPPGAPYDVKVPTERRKEIMTALAPTRRTMLAQTPGTTRASSASQVHVVRPRETITSIAKRYGVSTGEVLRMNSLEKHDSIRPGDRLRIAGAAR